MKSNDKYLKTYNENRDLSYQHTYIKNKFYNMTESQKLPVDGFKMNEKYQFYRRIHQKL